MQSTAQRFHVPAGFSGWWCVRCEKGMESIPEEAGSPARCPKCHRWTVWFVPVGLTADGGGQTTEGSKRQPSGRALESEMAGPSYERTRPKDEDAKRLFDHVRACMDNPELNPNLREIEDEEAKR